MQNETTYNKDMPLEYGNFVSAAEYLEKAEKRMDLRLAKLRKKDNSAKTAVKQNTKEYYNA